MNPMSKDKGVEAIRAAETEEEKRRVEAQLLQSTEFPEDDIDDDG